MALREMQRRHLVEIECQWMEELHLISPAYAQRDLTGRIMAMAILIGQIHEASRELSLPGELRRGADAEDAITDAMYRLLIRQRCAQLILYATL